MFLSGPGPTRCRPSKFVTSGANKWTVPSALPTQSKSPPQLTAWALSAQRAANTMYRARSLLQKIGRDLIRMNAAVSWPMQRVRASQASALRSQTTCSQPTSGTPRNRQHYHLTNRRSPVPLLASHRLHGSARDARAAPERSAQSGRTSRPGSVALSDRGDGPRRWLRCPLRSSAGADTTDRPRRSERGRASVAVRKHRKVIISLVSVAGTSAVDPQRSSLSETSDLLALSVTRALLQRSEKWRFAVWFEL
jgi:hypothetical protein